MLGLKLNHVSKRGHRCLVYCDNGKEYNDLNEQPDAAWMSNYIHYKVCDEIAYPFPNFNEPLKFGNG